MEKFKLLATVCIILMRDGKILLTTRYDTGWHDGDLDLPCGHIDGKEPITKAAARRAYEEIGVHIKPEDLEVVHITHRFSDDDECIEFYLKAEKWDWDPVNKEPDKANDVNWFPISGLPENIIPKAKFAIEQYLEGIYFSEFDWDE